jgi:serine/threonine protein kinase
MCASGDPPADRVGLFAAASSPRSMDGFLYYVMPYIEGQSLREKIAKEGELPVGEAVRILRDVVDALTAAHALAPGPIA